MTFKINLLIFISINANKFNLIDVGSQIHLTSLKKFHQKMKKKKKKKDFWFGIKEMEGEEDVTRRNKSNVIKITRLAVISII